MSALSQLGVSGIRSFDSGRLQVITFEGPLTLIVGANGSGKTTIIESLKYVTTGQFPPNSKGGAFVHDPDLKAEATTKAQVKLRFKATTGAMITATRNLEVSIKPSLARSIETLECSLVSQEQNGEKITRSTIVAELNTEIPRLLGVSKAILDSVIFCHQEESLWPMSEPGPLKKRFDEIFDATKYIKAIDRLQKMGKENNEKLKLARNDLEHLTKHKNIAADFVKKMNQLMIDMGEIDENITALTEKAQVAEENEIAEFNAAAQFTDVIEKLKSARSQKIWLNSRLQELKKDLEQKPDTDEALQIQLDEFENRLTLQQEQLAERTRFYESLHRDIKSKINEIGTKKTEVGVYAGEKATHERNIVEREQAIKKSARDHEFRGYDTDLDNAQISEYLEKITRLSKDQTSKLDRLRAENERKQLEAQKVLDGLRQQHSTFEANRSAKKDQLVANEQRVTNLNEEAEHFSIDDAGIASLQDTVKDVETSVAAVKSQLNLGDFDSKLKASNSKIQQLEVQENFLNTEFKDTSKRAGDLAAVTVLKKNLKDAKRDLDNKVNTYRQDFDRLLGGDWQLVDLEKSFAKAQKEQKDIVGKVKRQYDGAAREVERMDDKIKAIQSNISVKETEISRCAAAIQEKGNCDPDEFLEELDNAKQSRDTRQTDVDSFMGMKKFFEEAIKMAEHDKKCRLCRRGFKEPKEIETVVSNLKKQFSDQAQQSLQAELDEFIQDLSTLESCTSDHADWLRLTRQELPPLREELQALTSKRAQSSLAVDKEEEQVSISEENQREVDKLASHVNAIVNLQHEEAKLDAALKQAAATEEITSSLRTIDDIGTELENVKINIKEHRQTVHRLQNEERLLREQLGKHAVELGEAKNSLNVAVHQLQSKASVLKQIADLKQYKQDLRKDISDLDSQLGNLLPQIQAKEKDQKRQRAEAQEEERSANIQANNLKAEVNELMIFEYNISKYLEKGGPANLDRCQKEIRNLERERDGLDEKVKEVTRELNRIKDEISNQDKVKRVILDNLNYRKTLREFNTVDKEIHRMTDQNAEADQAEHRRSASRWQAAKESANTERAGEMVRKKEKDNQYQEIEDNLESNYKDVEQQYVMARIETVTLVKIIKDLNTYATALDSAIMEYHSTKMDQINRIIAELWTETYQGTDIDTICIRSEHHPTSRRSHDYRVTMRKQNVEMDMRGRCSAGQRVLASIIIRLALAECFSEYCGMIALDEPTTNLDRENITSLAESLHKIIEARRGQTNFQLIVITHDEDFIKTMRPSGQADSFYRVYRNQKQKSEIRPHPIYDL